MLKKKVNQESGIENKDEEKKDTDTVQNDTQVGDEPKSEWQMKAEEYLADLQRTQADFENYRKRQQESQKELGGYLVEKLVLDIVPVLDNFRSATMHVPPEQKDSPWVIGIQYIEKQLEDVVKSNGVEVIEVKEGDAFDPTIHEAVDNQQKTESTDQKSKNEEGESRENQPHTVAKVLQKGFRLGGKVIRPAKVTVK